jgi:dihydroorotate dehydrogenase electron transfer subunit
MIQSSAQVTDVETPGPFVRVALAAPTIAPGLAPGRFVLADLGNEDYLRTPLFPAWIKAEAFGVLISPNHPAAALQPGAEIDLVGPLGQGFEVPETTRRLLLVADTSHLPVLLPLLETRFFPKNPISPSATLLLSAPTAGELYPIRLLPPALEVLVATADGSTGYEGNPLDLLPDLVRWADCVCAASDPADYSAMAGVVREVRIGPNRRFAQALVVPPLACGVGACQGCAVKVARGTRLACTDGPVFDLLDLR